MYSTVFNSSRACIVACALVLATSTAEATMLLPDTAATPGILSGLAGTIVSNGGVVSMIKFPLSASNPLFSGILRTAVFDPGVPGGPLDFYYQVSNNRFSLTSLSRMDTFLFDHADTSVFYRTDAVAGFATPTSASPTAPPPIPLSADRDSSGFVVGFDYALPGSGSVSRINPGDTSFIVVIRTNATAFMAGGASLIGGGSITLPAFAPVALAPEPASLVLLGSAFGLAGFLARRRQARQQQLA